MTHKTGNFKKFGVFVKMLCSSLKQVPSRPLCFLGTALQIRCTHGTRHESIVIDRCHLDSPQTSESVFVDLLTYSDLEMLRSRQARKPASSTTSAKPNNKRYLILTYQVEYDRVHYPLPLSHIEEPPAHALQATIRRLRADLQRAGNGSAARSSNGNASGEVEDLRRQVSELKSQLRRSAKDVVGGAGGGESGPSAQDFDVVMRERDDARREADAQRSKVAQLTRENDKLDAELQKERARHEDRGEREAHARALREARRNLTDLENDLANEREEARQEQAELRHQIVALTRQNDAAQQQILDLKGQVIDLKQDIEVAKRRSRIDAECSTDPRLESRRQIYGTSPSSRPSSAERRRPSPQPARPFQRFDPTAYVKEKQNMRARSVSPRPGVPSPQSRPGSAPSSRPGSSERRRPSPQPSRPAWGGGGGSARSPAGGSKTPSSARSPSSATGGSSKPVSRPRPTSRERERPWAQPPMSMQQRLAAAQSSRPASAERARPRPSSSSAMAGGSRRPASAERARPWASGSTGTASRGGAGAARPWSASDARRGGAGASPSYARSGGSLAKPPASPRAWERGNSTSAAGEGRRRGQLSPAGAEARVNNGRESGGRRGGGGASSASEGEENRRPMGVNRHGAEGRDNGAESDDISDIDARLNALQNFLRAAKDKAKAASTSRSLRA